MRSSDEATIEQQTFDDALVVRILVKMMRDQDVVSSIRESMSDAVSESNCANLIIDVGQVEFISSVGFLAFLAMRRVPNVSNIVICNINPNVRELFQLCRLISKSNQNSAPFMESPTVESALELCRVLR